MIVVTPLKSPLLTKIFFLQAGCSRWLVYERELEVEPNENTRYAINTALNIVPRTADNNHLGQPRCSQGTLSQFCDERSRIALLFCKTPSTQMLFPDSAHRAATRTWKVCANREYCRPPRNAESRRQPTPSHGRYWKSRVRRFRFLKRNCSDNKKMAAPLRVQPQESRPMTSTGHRPQH